MPSENNNSKKWQEYLFSITTLYTYNNKHIKKILLLRTADTVEIIKDGSEKPVTMSLGGIKASELTDICTIRRSVIVQKFCCC